VKDKNFLHKVGRSWISGVQNRSESSYDDFQLPEKQTTPRGNKQDLPGRFSGDLRLHKLEKIVAGGEERKKYPARQCKLCAAPKKRSETRYICKFCVGLLHNGFCFQKYHSVMNYYTFYMQYLQSGAQMHNLQCQTVSKIMLWG
jgi:hypothetical protein